MPRLLEIQRAVNCCLMERDQEAVAPLLPDRSAIKRLDIYHNTIFSGLTKALCLTYPAVQRLVGVDFFEAAAQLFIVRHPPRAAYLNCYGGEFPDFLRDLPAAAVVAYLADVARLEWAVHCAIHAPDIKPLELAALAAVKLVDQGRVSLSAHPSVHLLRVDYPVDVIWRAVLADDEQTLRAVDPSSGPVHLVVGRRSTAVEVARLEEMAWHFLAELHAGRTIRSAIDSCPDPEAAATLAEHLALGWFVAFKLAAWRTPPPKQDFVA